MASPTEKIEVMKQCRKYFNSKDLNYDGKLNPAEFSAMCNEIKGCIDLTVLKRCYTKADRNKDGIVSFAEFMEAFANSQEEEGRPKGKTRSAQASDKEVDIDTDDLVKQIRHYFQEIDSDGSGKLDPNEFAQMLEKIGVHLGRDELLKIYKKADENGDGEVSFREFLSAFADERKKNKKKGKRPGKLPSRGTPSKFNDINDKDIMEGLACFWNCDQNLDGKLDFLEYSTMVHLLGMKLSKRDVLKAFKIADVSGQGFISYMNYVTIYMNKIMPGAMTQVKIKEAYQDADKGCKGYLTPEEFHECMKKLGNTGDRERLDKLLMQAFKNAAGKVTYRSFCEFVGLESSEVK